MCPAGLERSWCEHCSLDVVFLFPQDMNGGSCINPGKGKVSPVYQQSKEINVSYQAGLHLPVGECKG